MRVTQGTRGRGVTAAALLMCVGLAACDTGPGEGVLVVEPGPVVATYPEPGADDPPAIGFVSALHAAGDEIWVVDQQAARVHRFEADGAHLGAVGREGEGPGELQKPTEVVVGPDGDVWVADPPAGRVTRFRPDGSLAEERRAPFGSTDFGLLPGGRMVVPSPTRDRLLAVVGPENEITELSAGPDSPAALASMSPRERFGFMGTFLETDPESGEVYFLLNRETYGLWRMRVDEEAGTVARPGRIAIPGWLDEALTDTREEQREDLGEAGLQFVPFNDLRLTGRGLWLTTGPLGVVGVRLPVEDGGRPVVVRPSEDDVDEGRLQGLLHASLRPEGLYAAYPTEVRVFALDTVGVRREPDLP